jgi:hypothetical protein
MLRRPVALAAAISSALVIPIGRAHAQLDAPPEPVLPTEPAPLPSPPVEPAPPVAAPSPARPPAPGPAPSPAAALTPPPSPAAFAPPPPSPSRYQSTVSGHRPSPEWTQDRSFTSTRFWLLDPGQFEVETWLRTRIQHQFTDPATGLSSRAPAEILLQGEVEIGLAPHLQIDLYENLTFNVDASGSRGVQQEGVQIEARIAIPSYYGQVFGNPVIYLEFHPRHADPDRAEIRLLLGGALTNRLYLAVNPYFETNVEKTDVTSAALDALGKPTLVTTSSWILDAELGTTVALGLKVTEWLRLSGELKIGWDMLGSADNTLHFVAWAGPGFILKPLPGRLRHYLKVMGTLLIDLVPRSDPNVAPQLLEPLLIIGSQF